MCKLREFRTQKGISQEKMAREMEVSLSMFAKVEQGAAKAGLRFHGKSKRTLSRSKHRPYFFD